MKDSQDNVGRLEAALSRLATNAPTHSETVNMPQAPQRTSPVRPQPRAQHGIQPCEQRGADAPPESGKQSPQRTCVGCRQTDSRHTLMRVVTVLNGTVCAVRLDPRAVLPGRGVWLHPESTCVSNALRRKALQRGLHCAHTADLSEVEQWGAQLKATQYLDTQQ